MTSSRIRDAIIWSPKKARSRDRAEPAYSIERWYEKAKTADHGHRRAQVRRGKSDHTRQKGQRSVSPASRRNSAEGQHARETRRAPCGLPSCDHQNGGACRRGRDCCSLHLPRCRRFKSGICTIGKGLSLCVHPQTGSRSWTPEMEKPRKHDIRGRVSTAITQTQKALRLQRVRTQGTLEHSVHKRESEVRHDQPRKNHFRRRDKDLRQTVVKAWSEQSSGTSIHLYKSPNRQAAEVRSHHRMIKDLRRGVKSRRNGPSTMHTNSIWNSPNLDTSTMAAIDTS